MVHTHEISAAVSLASGLIAIALLAFSLRAHHRTGLNAFVFLGVAFTIFAFKSLVVAWAVWNGSIAHDDLELVDAVGDLSTVLLLVAPIFFPQRTP